MRSLDWLRAVNRSIKIILDDYKGLVELFSACGNNFVNSGLTKLEHQESIKLLQCSQRKVRNDPLRKSKKWQNA